MMHEWKYKYFSMAGKKARTVVSFFWSFKAFLKQIIL